MRILLMREKRDYKFVFYSKYEKRICECWAKELELD